MIYAKLFLAIATALLDILTIRYRTVILPAAPWALLFFLAGVIAVNIMAFRAARAKRNRQWSEL